MGRASDGDTHTFARGDLDEGGEGRGERRTTMHRSQRFWSSFTSLLYYSLFPPYVCRCCSSTITTGLVCTPTLTLRGDGESENWEVLKEARV